MKKLLLIALLIVGCSTNPMESQKVYGCTVSTASNFNPNATVFDNSCEYEEFQEVEWIYYGNNNQPLTGCYWTGVSFPDQTIPSVGSESDLGVFLFVDSNENLHTIQCESGGYGQTDYIRYFADEDYFSILSINPIYPHNYDTLMYEYK